MGFWEAFKPDFVATILGALLGVPAGLWLSRLLEARQGAREKERLVQALEELVSAAEANLDLLRSVHGHLEAGRIVTGMSINLSTWDVVRSEVLHGLRRTVGLRVRIAAFFEELALFAQHLERFVTWAVQPRSGDPPLWDVEGALGRPALMPFAARLVTALEELHAELVAEHALLARAPRRSRALELAAGLLAALVLGAALVAIPLGH